MAVTIGDIRGFENPVTGQTEWVEVVEAYHQWGRPYVTYVYQDEPYEEIDVPVDGFLDMFPVEGV